MNRTRPLIEWIAQSMQARINCERMNNREWFARHTETLREYEQFLPSGAGIDNGSRIDLERSTGDRIVLLTAFHHMHESGMYDGWTQHNVTIRPAFIGLDIRVSGQNRNEIRDYLACTFRWALVRPVEITIDGMQIAS